MRPDTFKFLPLPLPQSDDLRTSPVLRMNAFSLKVLSSGFNLIAATGKATQTPGESSVDCRRFLRRDCRRRERNDISRMVKEKEADH